MDDSNRLRDRLDGQSGGLKTLPIIRASVRDELPFPKGAQAKVREIVQLEQGNGWTLYGKTGWADAEPPGIGWWVGWVQKGDRLHSFALNIDMPKVSDAIKRNELDKAILKILGVL